MLAENQRQRKPAPEQMHDVRHRLATCKLDFIMHFEDEKRASGLAPTPTPTAGEPGNGEWASDDALVITATVQVRVAARADLDDLEWHGMFTAHRALIDEAFARQERGNVLMLVSELGGFPVGQIWIDFVRTSTAAARLWAFRVMPGLQRLGIGSGLLRVAERAVARRGLASVELGCEKHNTRARRFYQKRGYVVTCEQLERYSYQTPAGTHIEATSDQWIMHKLVGESA